MLFHRCEDQLLVFHTDLLSELGESPTLVTTPLITSHDLSDDFNMESILESSNQVVRTKKKIRESLERVQRAMQCGSHRVVF